MCPKVTILDQYISTRADSSWDAPAPAEYTLNVENCTPTWVKLVNLIPLGPVIG